jgi:hypothetical protein
MLGHLFGTADQEGEAGWVRRVAFPERAVSTGWIDIVSRESSKGAATFDIGSFASRPLFVVATNTTKRKATKATEIICRTECTKGET